MIRTFLKNIIYILFSKFIIRVGPADSIYLTFDDGPHPVYTGRIIEILSRYSITSTFFMTGIEMLKYPNIVFMVKNSGHRIAFHGYTHTSMKKQTLNEFISDMKHVSKLESMFGIKLNLYRPPYGDLTLSGFLYLAMNRWKIVMWSLDSKDSFDTEEKVIETVSCIHVKLGDILLFHDDYELTARSLDTILTNYQNAGFKLNIIL